MYRRKEGKPIGENIFQIAADLVMFKLMGGFKKRLKRLNLVAILLKLYVDDLNQAGECLPFGSQYKEGTLYVPGQGWRGRSYKGTRMTKEEKEQMVRTAEEMAASNYSQGDRERYSASIYRQLANDLCPKSVRMVEDVPANHESGWLPILDIKMAAVGECIVH